MDVHFQVKSTSFTHCLSFKEALQEGGEGGGGNHVARLNFKTSRVGVYKSCRLLSALSSLSQFGRGRLSLVAIPLYTLSLLFGPGRLSEFTLAGPLQELSLDSLSGNTVRNN